MRLLDARGEELWLTYCMNVHPGGTEGTTAQAVRDVVAPLRRRLGASGPFGVGLRLEAGAVRALAADAGRTAGLRDLLLEHDLVPFTANAFVLGAFHGEPLKEGVYAPDWRDPARRAYTLQVARLLAHLRPEHARFSVSTAPGSWRAWGTGRAVDEACARELARTARGLVDLEAETGVRVRLGLEPEPGCTLQSTDEAIAFFEGPLARALDGEDRAAGHLGLCFDVCHQAVVHEDLPLALRRLEAAGVPVVKVQASSALEVLEPAEPAARADLAAFDDGVYLHQVGARDADGRLHVASDLPEALAGGGPWAAWAPWRVHFHVPVFLRATASGALGTTRDELDRVLAAVARGGVTDHLEIETYTWAVLPEAERRAGTGFDLVEALAREYEHVLGVLERGGCRRPGPDGGEA